VNNIEELMAELAKSSVDLKRKLYRRDEAASTSPDGTDGSRIEVHTCRVCDRSAVGEGAGGASPVQVPAREAAKGTEGSS
jgi:hypothetical protein